MDFADDLDELFEGITQRHPLPNGDDPADDIDIEDLNCVEFSLSELVTMATELYTVGLFARFVLFVLCGVADGYKVVLNIFLDQNRSSQSRTPHATRDFDSLLGICPRILVRGTELMFTMTSQWADDLRNNVHIVYEWVDSLGTLQSALIHTIPNAHFATFGTRNSIILMFPGLWDPARKNGNLDINHRRAIYECGIRPAMVRLLGSRSGDLPTTLASEIFRATNADGRLSFTTKVFPSWFIEELSELIPAFLVRSGHKWAEGMVYLHMIRGVKNSSYHGCLPGAANTALQTFFNENNIPLAMAMDPEMGTWFIDVGLELAQPRKSLLWSTDGHASVYQEVTGVDSNNALRITTLGSSQYARDHISHLVKVSGCRITPGPHGQGRFGVVYFQMYVTDKSLTASKANGQHAKHITGAQVIRKPASAATFLERLIKLYQDASDANYSCCRVEVRVPLRFATEVFMGADVDTFVNATVSVDISDLWGYRASRALALNYLLDWQRADPGYMSRSSGALLLTATTPFLVNSLSATVDNRSASRELMRAILPHGKRSEVDRDDLPFPTSLSTTREEDEEQTVPKVDRGAFFLRYLLVGPRHRVPRFPGTRFISDSACVTLLGDNLKGIMASLTGGGMSVESNPVRVRNKAPQLRLPSFPEGPAPFDDLPGLQGLRINPPSVDSISDDSGDEDEAALDFFPDTSISGIVSDILRHFFPDILNTSPNATSIEKGATIRLTEAERSVADATIFQERNFGRLFNASRWKRANAEKEEWKALFNKLFPSKGHQLPARNQNYRQTVYYRRWFHFRKRVSHDVCEQVRRVIWRKVFKKEIYWLPFVQADCIWDTRNRAGKVFQDLPRLEEDVPCVNIVVNGRLDPTFDPDVVQPGEDSE